MLSVLSGFAMGAAVCDEKGRVLMADEAYAAIFKCSTGEIVGALRDAITHPEDRGRNLLALDRQKADGRTFEISKRYLLPNGEAVWVENRVSLLAGEAGRYLVLSRPLPEEAVAAAPDRANRMAFAGVVSETTSSLGLQARRFSLPQTAELLDAVADTVIPEALDPPSCA